MPKKVKRKSILDPYWDTIREWLEQDRIVRRKQRHTAQRIWKRLRDEYGFTGSYETVQKGMKQIRRQMRREANKEQSKGEAYLPLE